MQGGREMTSTRTNMPACLWMAAAVSLALVGGLLAPSTATGAPATAAIKLKPSYGPPTTKVKVTGTGFGATEQVVIKFSKDQVGTATTDPAGSFAAKITVPASALPGTHTVRATGQTSGLLASRFFLVRTDWAKFHFDQRNSGFNPYENVLDPSNVAGLVKAWNYRN